MFNKNSLSSAVIAILLAKSPGMALAQTDTNPKLQIQPIHGGAAPAPEQQQAATFPEYLFPAAVPRTASCNSGCANQSRWKQCLEANFLGYLPEFDAPPLGATIATHFQAQVSEADYSRMMLHDFDFCINGADLNVRGRDFVIRKAKCLGKGPFVVEHTPYAPTLADARRQVVLNFLASVGVAVTPEMVVVGRPQGLPVSGEEALIVYQNLLLQTRTVGTTPSAGTSSMSGGFMPTPGFLPGSGFNGGSSR